VTALAQKLWVLKKAETNSARIHIKRHNQMTTKSEIAEQTPESGRISA
jgi:hypothetical protein